MTSHIHVTLNNVVKGVMTKKPGEKRPYNKERQVADRSHPNTVN
jgi:hypothetical protein